MATRDRVEFGDWQTPPALAEATLARLEREGCAPRTIIEPTCGVGAFLVAAARRFPRASLLGWELDRRHAAKARDRLPRDRSRIVVADFFAVDWEKELASVRGPILVTGNPPWVTSARLGALGSSNLPAKENFKALRGLDAITGKSNFDVAEWMLLRLIGALGRARATIGVLCKSAVARRVIERDLPIAPGGIFRIDAEAAFGASVDAVLFTCETRSRAARARAPRTSASAPSPSWPVYAKLGARKPASSIARRGGILVADVRAFARTEHLAGTSDPEWRSGIKHDCARVMELRREGRSWVNGFGERVQLEEEHVFPLRKSSDVANGRAAIARAMIVPQRSLGEDTTRLRRRAPKTWAYLERHDALLAARKSSIYDRRPPFSVFGVGPYSFAPFKVAVSGLYKRYAFSLVAPVDGRPVVLDDTCYFLPFEREDAATRALEALRSPLAAEFFAARTFWDAKRPISKAILQGLDLRALSAQIENAENAPR